MAAMLTGRRRRSSACLAFMLLIMAPAHEAAAQQPVSGQPEGMLFGTIPVVTGASRFSQDADEAPASITVISAEEIARQGWRTLAEALQSVRGFYPTYDRNYTYLGVRGFGQPGDFNTRILVLLDGQRLNENAGGGVYLATESPVEMALVDRMEVIRGPGSSLYGTGAFFAVVNVISKRGRDLRGGELAGSLQSFGGREVRATAGTRKSSGLEVLASGTLFRSTGQDLFFPEFNDPATNFGRSIGLDGDRREHGLIEVTRGALTLLTNFSRREKFVPTASHSTIFNDSTERTTDRNLMVALAFAPTIGSRGQLRTSLSYHSYDNFGVYPIPDFSASGFISGRWWIGDANYAARLGQSHQVVLGGEYQFNARQAQGVTDIGRGIELFRNDSRVNTWAFYAQDEIRLGARVLLNAGLRLDHSANFGATLNPRLGLIYHHAGSGVKLLAGRAFRAPNNYEQYFADGVDQKGNLDLIPESIWSVEAVLDRQLGRHWRISLSAYQNRIRRLIALVIDPVDSLRVFRNVGSVNGTGLEVEAEGEAGGLNLRASYGLQHADDGATGADVANSPHHLVKLEASRAFFRDRLTLGAELQGVSRRVAVYRGDVPGHAVVNLTLRSQRWPRGISAALSIYNLTNARYGDPAPPEDVQTAIPQDGRALRLTLQLDF